MAQLKYKTVYEKKKKNSTELFFILCQHLMSILYWIAVAELVLNFELMCIYVLQQFYFLNCLLASHSYRCGVAILN